MIKFARTLAWMIFAFAAAACDRSESTQSIRLKTRLFTFDYQAVQNLEYWVGRPTPWGAQFEKKSDTWQVVSAPDGMALSDSLADGRMIQKFLDSLTTLTPQKKALKAPISHFGLEPPHYIFRWSVGKNRFEIHLGDPIDLSGARFARFPLLAPDEVFEVEGATLAMLERITRFTHIRHQRAIHVDLDWIHRVNLKELERPILSLNREGAKWKHPNDKIASPKTHEWLKRLVHIRFASFVDDKGKQMRLQGSLPHTPFYTFEFFDRRGQSFHLVVHRIEGRFYASNSGRGSAFHPLYREVIEALVPPKQP